MTPMNVWSHDIEWLDHDRPRWNTAKCKKCDRQWSVHNDQALDFVPPADCEVR